MAGSSPACDGMIESFSSAPQRAAGHRLRPPARVSEGFALLTGRSGESHPGHSASQSVDVPQAQAAEATTMTTAVPDSKNGSTPTEQGTPAAPAVLFQLTMGTFVAQAVSTAARLGVADVLADGPCDLRTIAEQVDADAGTLYRLLRALGDF